MPAPTTTYLEGVGLSIAPALMRRGLPALEHRRLPVGADDGRPGHPGPELRLRELRVRVLELNAVRVAGLEVLDQHLAGKLVLAPGRDRKVDLQERVRVAVEDGGNAVLLEQLHVLEPVEVRARRRGEQVDVLDERDVLLIREAAPREDLGVERRRLAHLEYSSSRLISSSARSSETPGT